MSFSYPLVSSPIICVATSNIPAGLWAYLVVKKFATINTAFIHLFCCGAVNHASLLNLLFAARQI